MDVRQRFRELEKHVDGLVSQLRASTADTRQLPQRETLDTADLALRTSSLLIGGSGSAVEAAPAIVIPGISSGSGKLITPVSQPESNPEPRGDRQPADNRQQVREALMAVLEAPLVAIGARDPGVLQAAGESTDSSWTQWWIDACAASDTRQAVAQRYMGQWFAHSVLGSASLLLVGPSQSDNVVERLVMPYISSGDDMSQITACWQATKSTVGIFARSRHAAAGELTLALRVLIRAVEHERLLDVAHMLSRLNGLESVGGSVRAEWAEYVQLVCSLPERVANKIDARSVPGALCPRPYYARLAQQAVACISQIGSGEPQKQVLELWTKMCRVGQLDSLCVELAAALAAAARTRIEASNRLEYEKDALAVLARAISRMPDPFGARVVSGIVQQLDAVNGASWIDASSRQRVGGELALIVSALVHGQLSEGDSVDRAVSAVLTRFGASGAGVSGTLSRWSALGTYQAIALALQLLSGKPVESGIADALPARVFPELLGEALGRVIVPLWALPEHVHGGQLEAVKALSALVMMCLGAATAAEGRALSMSPAFMQAVPRYLDAPVPLVRLSGVIVADRIVSLAQRASDSDSIDFGLQDILDEAHDTDQPVVRASAEYIAEMRKYSRPVAEQWADAEPTADGESGSAQSLVEALGRVQELGAEGADEQAVLAPRQSTLTGEAGVESAYVRPRPPVYLRDCLAYLRDRAEGSERVEVALFALAGCVERANVKAVEELWVQLANKVLYTYNRGPDRLDAAWDAARQRALVALAVRLPQQMGPYLADRSCDRNLTLADRELVLSAIGTACLRLSGRESEGSGIEDVTDEQGSQGVPDSAGTVVRRSRRLDIAARRPAPSADPAQRAYAGLAGPAFFLPLAAQFGRSDTSAQASDVRGDAGQLARYVDVLGVILYSAPAATHQLAMARAFLGLVGLVQRLPARTGEARPVLDALLFGIDALLTPGRALSTPTLAREFGGELGGVLRWIGALLERGLLGESAAAAHAARIVERLREIQADVGRRVASSDFDRYTSII